MCGIDIFEQYLKDGDMFVWNKSHVGRVAYCVVKHIDIGAYRLHCDVLTQKIRTVDGVPFYFKQVCTLTKVEENTPYVFKVIENFTGREIHEWTY